MKTCTKCGTQSDESGFYKDARRSDGLQGHCKRCMLMATAKWHAEHPVRVEEIAAAARKRNPGRSTQYVRLWRALNPERSNALNAPSAKRREIDRARYATNPERRASVDRRSREWARRHPETEWAKTVRRRTALLRRNVAWADTIKIKALYIEAKKRESETGVPHQVDHVIPLRGETVSGLHWEGNMQVLPRLENIRKSNKLIEAIV